MFVFSLLEFITFAFWLFLTVNYSCFYLTFSVILHISVFLSLFPPFVGSNWNPTYLCLSTHTLFDVASLGHLR